MKAMLCVVFVLGVAAAAGAQIVTSSQRLARATLPCAGDNCEPPAAVLTRHFARGDLARLQAYGAELVRTFAHDGPPDLKAALGDLARNYYRLIWLSRDDSGATSLQSFVVHAGATGLVRTLPGIDESSAVQLVDVFVSADPTAVLETQYVSTPVKDPLAAQIPAFVEKTGVVGFLAGLPLARGAAAADARTVTTVTVARPILPVARAELKIQDTLIVPGSVSGLRNASEELTRRLIARDVRLSACGQALAAADGDAVTKTLRESACAVPEARATGLTAAEAGHCRTAMLTALDEAFTSASACRDTPPAPGADPLLIVDKAFTELVGSMRESRRTSEWKLANTPRTRYAFGVLTAAIIGPPHYSVGTVRARIGSTGAIVLDPMPTLLTMAQINVHPVPYDPQSDAPAWAERFRLFAGTAVTPDFGLGGGAGVLIVRGLSANVGWANLFVKSVRGGFSVGQAPAAGTSPFSAGNAGVWFAGLSYSFK